MLRVGMAQMGRISMEGPGRDRVAAVAGILSVVVFVIGQYVAPALVWPAEQVAGLVATFYVNFEDRLLAEAILFGVASALFLVFLGGLWAVLGRAEGQQPRLARSWLLPGP
jgi:ABC-type spermidine/putrescine transport system permease subunit I